MVRRNEKPNVSHRGILGALRLLARPCRDFAEVISESMERELSLGERLAIRFHTLYCNSCRRYLRQVRAIRQMIARWLERAGQAEPTSEATMPAELRERIEQALRDAH